jgi:hypothetical protein
MRAKGGQGLKTHGVGVGFGFILISLLWAVGACKPIGSGALQANQLQTAEGRTEWEQQEPSMLVTLRTAVERYKREHSLDALQDYEKTVRAYVDHGFILYRGYQAAKLQPPSELATSLEKRTALLMDVADEYIKQGSQAVAEGIASDVIHDYSDLPVMGPSQRRAERLLQRYRYRKGSC